MSLYEKHYACRAFVRLINSRMKTIAVKLGIDQKVTTSISRHSFSTQLKRSGASTKFIQEALGHMDKRTTEYYLGSFEKSVKREFANALMAFKKTAS
jgi:site-specific recombinase XerD